MPVSDWQININPLLRRDDNLGYADNLSGDTLAILRYDESGGDFMCLMNEKLRILLANNNWTQSRLANVLCVSPDTVSSWVRGKNCLSIEMLKRICDIFAVPVQDIVNDSVDFFRYYEIDRYLPDRMCRLPEKYSDSIHIVYEAGLANEGKLHRFTNCAKEECSAIYRAGMEVWWHYREYEARMIHDWNEVYSDDR